MNTPQQIEQLRQELISEDISSYPLEFQNARIFSKKSWISGSADLSHVPPLSPVSKSHSRLQICETCEFYRSGFCLKCGFTMKHRVNVELAQCPINKWGPNLQMLLTDKQLPNPLGLVTLRNDQGPEIQYIYLSEYPQNEKDEIILLAQNSLANGGFFSYKDVKYQAKMVDGGLEVYFVVPRDSKINVTSHLSMEEKAELNQLAKTKLQEENSTKITLEYKNVKYDVKSIGNNKIILSLASGSAIPTFAE